MLNRKRKQRACYFTDSEWDSIKETSKALGYTTASSFVQDAVSSVVLQKITELKASKKRISK